MSLRAPATFTCPGCGHESETTVWQSLNVTVDPDMATAAHDGSIFDHTCAVCGETSRVFTPLLYHDMDRKFMIAFDPDGRRPSSEFAGAVWNPLREHRFRLVATPLAFFEKRLLLSLGVDDRSIESYKAFLLAMVNRAFMPARTTRLSFKMLHPPEGEVKAIWFDCYDDAGEHLGEFRESYAHYIDFAETWARAIERYERLYTPPRWQVIDNEWGRRQHLAARTTKIVEAYRPPEGLPPIPRANAGDEGEAGFNTRPG